MPAWIYFILTPRDNFAATMTGEEEDVWAAHFERLKRMERDGTLVLAGPTLGQRNDGIVIFEAPDEDAARKIMDEDPTILSGYARGELRAFKVSLGRAARTPGPTNRRPSSSRRSRSQV